MSRQTYHHGNLRNELIDLAGAELEQHGREAISLRDLASRLGVARSAPYRHFESRDDLLRAVASVGVEEIRQCFSDAIQLQAPPRERLRAGCRSFLKFARRREKLYRLMFDTDIGRDTDIELEARPQSSFGVFTQLVADAVGVSDDVHAHKLAVACWAILHGYAMLSGEHRVNRDGFIAVAEETVIALATRIDVALETGSYAPQRPEQLLSADPVLSAGSETNAGSAPA